MKRKNLLLFLIVAVFSMLIVGCSTQKTETAITTANGDKKAQIKFNDILGREVVLDKPAERVFLGFYFENFLAINGIDSFDKVVAMSKGEWSDFFYSQWLKYSKEVPRLNDIVDTGSIYSGKFSMEKLLATRPDVAILAPFQYETLGANVEKLEQAGIPVVVVDYNAQTLEKHIKSTLIIGKVMGNEERAKQLADEYKSAVEDVKNRVAKSKQSVKSVYFELANKGPNVYGNSYGNYMWGNLVKLGGGKNIAEGKVESYGPLSPEYILSSNPDVIFFAGLNWAKKDKDCVLMGFDVEDSSTQEKLEAYIQRQGWDKLNAVKNREVYSMDHAGLRSLYDYVYLQYIAKALHPEVFKDINPLENHKKFYEKYLPVEPIGNFMTKLGGNNE
ncbi:ABC transporter substrate-binding protein [Tepidibacter thalassicus]|uniref:ABC-type Fe3+-hydroxamate transport system, substrate-binding protein n=1 Tax=Tepidibacter thalassicus DSM 15285 TaxID=1123350 RepID=A0A1M5QS71_9FIRM|nr:ABC transporter substrate-binding protein [Tepidibacter thalassicus]SHH16433.1 ABC-type Fe3+-hydroxamate transport system, substrate-binding protein [Tepidibacter thalassicus DSM 15285]